MNPSLVVSIKKAMEKKSTETLKKIYTKHGESWRSPEAFAAIYQVLTERGETVTPYAPDYEKVMPETTWNAETASPLSSPHATNVELPLNALPILGLAGVLLAVIGLGFLVSPAADGAAGIVNLHQLTIGETLTISGVILIAAQWRPR
jgi:hypothetical protein